MKELCFASQLRREDASFKPWVMAESASVGPKQIKRDARQKRDQAQRAFTAGDYAQARQLDLEVIALQPDSDLGREAAQEAENLRTDPLAIYLGLGSLALYILAWVYALLQGNP